MKTKNIKRTEAEDRQVKYDILTPKQKIDKLNKSGYRAAKQRKRLGFPEIPSECVK